jgi:secondary thiamine-phosphate synthase enzyme
MKIKLVGGQSRTWAVQVSVSKLIRAVEQAPGFSLYKCPRPSRAVERIQLEQALNGQQENRRIMVFQEQLTVSTSSHGDMHNLTEKVAVVVARSKVRNGIVHVFNIGSTAAVGTIEFEPGLQKDLPAILDHLMPPSRDYGHEQAWQDGNGHSHLQATMLGPGLTVPVCEGKLLLGTWQQIFHLECDTRPRQRIVVVTVLGV